MAKKTQTKELTGAQDLYNFLFEACNILRGPVALFQLFSWGNFMLLFTSNPFSLQFFK